MLLSVKLTTSFPNSSLSFIAATLKGWWTWILSSNNGGLLDVWKEFQFVDDNFLQTFSFNADFLHCSYDQFQQNLC